MNYCVTPCLVRVKSVQTFCITRIFRVTYILLLIPQSRRTHTHTLYVLCYLSFLHSMYSCAPHQTSPILKISRYEWCTIRLNWARKQKPQSEFEKDETKHSGAHEHGHEHRHTCTMYKLHGSNANQLAYEHNTQIDKSVKWNLTYQQRGKMDCTKFA